MKHVLLCALLLLASFGVSAQGTCTTDQVLTCTGAGAADNAVVISVSDARSYQSCVITSTAGAVDVFVGVGTVIGTIGLQLRDMNATTVTYVALTTVNRQYIFEGSYRTIQVLQNGVTAATAAMNCW